MHARFEIVQPFRLSKLLLQSASLDIWLSRIHGRPELGDWRIVDLSRCDDDDAADYSVPMWRAFPYALAFHQRQILFSRNRKMLASELGDLARPFFESHALSLSEIALTRYYLGFGIGSSDVSFVVENFEPDQMTADLVGQIDKFYNNQLWHWYEQFPFHLFEQLGCTTKSEKTRAKSGNTENYGFGLVVRADGALLDAQREKLVKCAQAVSGRSEEPEAFNNLDPDLYLSQSGREGSFVATTDSLAEVKAPLLWSIIILLYDALDDLSSPDSPLAAVRKVLTIKAAQKRLRGALNMLASAEQRFMSLTGMSSPARFQANGFDEAIHESMWRMHRMRELGEVGEMEIQRLSQLLQTRIAERDHDQQRRVSQLLYLVAVFGGVTAIGEVVRALTQLGFVSAAYGSTLTAGGIFVFLLAMLVAGFAAFR